MSASEHRQAAARAEQSAADSWERSDSDGFLSQWAEGLSAQKHRLAAEIAENGGKWHFKGLFDAQDRRVKARLVYVVDQYRGFGREKKAVWCLQDAQGKAIAWVNAHKDGPRSKMAQMGLHEALEEAPAKAVLEGSGYGLSGRAWVAAKRLDRGFPEGAVVLEMK
jgi:hypothetical protein